MKLSRHALDPPLPSHGSYRGASLSASLVIIPVEIINHTSIFEPGPKVSSNLFCCGYINVEVRSGRCYRSRAINADSRRLVRVFSHRGRAPSRGSKEESSLGIWPNVEQRIWVNSVLFEFCFFFFISKIVTFVNHCI